MVSVGEPKRRGLAPLIVTAEPWLPLAIGLVWWAAMYPGLFGEDSLITLTQARDGPVDVWFTAWWIYLIRFVTVGVAVVPLLTLFGVLTLTFAVRQWAAACFPAGVSRALATCLICATPLVGAFGIQVRHDVEMTAGLLLGLAVVTRIADEPSPRLAAGDIAQLALASTLIATRHNGVPTVVGAAIGCLLVSGLRRWPTIATLVAVAGGALFVTEVATRASGHERSVDRLGSVEWALTDISCLLSKDDVRMSEVDWASLTPIASRSDWPQRTACRFMDKELFHAASFHPSAVVDDSGRLLRVWLDLAIQNPAKMAAAHLERVRLFVPPFVAGIPRMDNLPFLHSTILPNDFGLQWQWPRIAGTVRLLARAWNAMAMIVANSGLWLIALIAAAWTMGNRGGRLRLTILFALVLELEILIAAPMSEGRYGLLILITGQVATLFALFDRWSAAARSRTRTA